MSSKEIQTCSYDPQSDEVSLYPHQFFKRLRSQSDMFWVENLNSWLVLDYEGIVELLKDPNLSSDRSGAMVNRLPAVNREGLDSLKESLGRWILFADPPYHTRVKEPLVKGFTKIFSDHLSGSIVDLTSEMLNSVEDLNHFDFMESIAYPLPVIVISEILGAEKSDRKYLKDLSTSLAKFVNRAVVTPTAGEEASHCMKEFEDYFEAIIKKRQKAPQNDLVSFLIESNIFSEEELLASCVMMLFAGHETTSNILGNGLHLLLSNPDSIDKAKRNLDKNIKGLVDEVLRYEPPIKFLLRVVKVPFLHRGAEFKEGDQVMLAIASANRDERVFESADEFLIGRKPNKHLSFGLGTHFCLGSRLGKLEGELVFKVLLEKFNSFKMNYDVPNWKRGGMRSLVDLPVSLL